MTDAAALLAVLESMATDAERDKYRRYFPDDAGGPFLGVRMGAVFELAKTALDLDAAELEYLLERPEHEARALACSIMAKSAARPRATAARRSELYELYLRRHDRIDQWDLVDLAARDVVGSYLADGDRGVLDRLAASAFWPERRTAIVATSAYIRRGEIDDAYRIAERLAADPEPLVQKATGWMLRYAGDRDLARLTAFAERNATTMGRVALRAAIEHLPKEERTRILAIR
jgi:3-methyladenine DNA glycosylase AlkD